MKKRITGQVLLLCLTSLPGWCDSEWKNSYALGQTDAWYGSYEAVRVAENVLLYQRDTGGWPKNEEMQAELSDAQKATIAAQKSDKSCFDNGATTTEMRFLAKVYKHQPDERYREAFNKALSCILEAQSVCGDGWPQYWPRRVGEKQKSLMKYSDFITFNDNLTTNILRVLNDVAEGSGDFADIVDEDSRKAARESYQKGLQCILNCQIRNDDGELTVWCAQHYPDTYLPAVGRRFELPSYSGAESADIASFLMGIDSPSAAVWQAVEGAVKWFETHAMENKEQESFTNKDGQSDKRIVDASGKRLWPRFAQIGGETGQKSFEALCDFLTENGKYHAYTSVNNETVYRSDVENARASYDPSRAEEPLYGIKENCEFRFIYNFNDTDSITDDSGIRTPTSLTTYDRTTYSFVGTWGESVLSSYQKWKAKYPTLPADESEEPEETFVSDIYNHYSEWLVESEMKRVAHPYNLDNSPTKTRWAYSLSIELEGMFDTYLTYRNETLGDYIKEYPAKMINADGSIERYNYDDFNLDNVRPGHFLLRFYNEYPAEKELTALTTLYNQLINQPRTDEGVWWHKKIYKQQVWLDGIFMGLPYYVLAAPQLQSDNVTPIYDDAVDQIVKTGQRTFDETTGLWKHAWDETHSMFWADPETGLSQHTWARALGWFSMAMLEVLEALPADYSRRGEVQALFQKVMAAVVRYQNAESGVWFDVLDVADERNYLEATASSMFTYCMLKGARLGLLDESYVAKGIEAYRNVVKQFVEQNEDGTISLTQCCQVSGLGPESSPRRDGSFEYYMSEPIVDNDSKGIGPFIWASLEMERRGYTVANLHQDDNAADDNASDDNASDDNGNNEPATDQPAQEFDSFKLSNGTAVAGNCTDAVYTFGNGFTITNSSEKKFAVGNEDGVKYSAGVKYTICMPEGISIDRISLTGYDNYNETDAYLSEVAGTNYESTDYTFPQKDSQGNYTVVTHTIDFAEPVTGSITFTPQGKQVVLVIELFSKKATEPATPDNSDEPTEPVAKRGDLNGDGKVDILDVTTLIDLILHADSDEQKEK